MTQALGWEDLLIENLSPQDVDAWLSPWSWLVKGRVKPLFLSRFGDWFLRRPDGSTELLDVLQGSLEVVARTPEEFEARLNDPAWQDERLLPRLVRRLKAQGTVPKAGECYAFAPHPAFTGRFDPETAVVMPIGTWQENCARLFQDDQIPDG